MNFEDLYINVCKIIHLETNDYVRFFHLDNHSVLQNIDPSKETQKIQKQRLIFMNNKSSTQRYLTGSIHDCQESIKIEIRLNKTKDSNKDSNNKLSKKFKRQHNSDKKG